MFNWEEKGFRSSEFYAFKVYRLFRVPQLFNFRWLKQTNTIYSGVIDFCAS